MDDKEEEVLSVKKRKREDDRSGPHKDNSKKQEIEKHLRLKKKVRNAVELVQKPSKNGRKKEKRAKTQAQSLINHAKKDIRCPFDKKRIL